MICTRDVFILIVAILLVGIGIIVTILVRPSSFSPVSALLLRSTPEETVFTAEGVQVEKNRSANIERLRDLIARGGTTITPSPSVESEEPLVNESVATSSEDMTAQSTLMLCGSDDSLMVKAGWPSGVTVMTLNGERVVSVSSVTPVQPQTVSASATPPLTDTITIKNLLVTRAFPVKGSTPQCVTGSVVGVTASGGLIENDASFYGEYGSQSLVGYARDGFPIYGFYEGEVDACGGYQHVNGYRYTLTKDRDTVLNCYFSTPASFTL